MLRKEVNDLLTQTDADTPMGEMFRHYWIPALLARELPEDDCPPVRVKLLGERLIAFRDSHGRYGLMDEFCAHQGRLSLVRAQRGRRAALPLSRLEIRLYRPVHRGALGTRRIRLLSEDQAQGLSPDQGGRRALDPYGRQGQPPARAGRGNSPPCPPSRHIPPSAGRNATGFRRWRAASTRAM